MKRRSNDNVRALRPARKEPERQNFELSLGGAGVILRASAPVTVVEFTEDQARAFGLAMLSLADKIRKNDVN